MLDPEKRVSWYIVGGVVVFFTVYLTVSAYREGLFDPAPPPSQDPALADPANQVDKVRTAAMHLQKHS